MHLTRIGHQESKNREASLKTQTLHSSPGTGESLGATSINKKLTSKLTAEPGENGRKWEIPVDKMARAKNRQPAQEGTRQR